MPKTKTTADTKRKLFEFSDLDGYAGKNEMQQQHIRCKYYSLWIKLISSDWFS